jgi:hypothetical protein
VRRALANVPTYMLFDDHEITDDWYISSKWCDQVLSKPLGRRVLQNGLLAYAVFQAWGNTPEQFEESDPRGGALLEAAKKWAGGSASNDYVYDEVIRDRLLPILDTKSKPIRVKNDMNRMSRHKHALDWHYTVTGPKHEVLVLDTRTWRGYPGRIDPPALLSHEGFQTQIGNQPDAGKEITIVVSPVPVFGPPFVEHAQKSSKTEKLRLKRDVELWGAQEVAFESLFATLTQRGKHVVEAATPKQKSRIIFLSGDVHFGFATRLQHWATKPFGFSGPEQLEMELVAAQLTSSALRNEEQMDVMKGKYAVTEALHVAGYILGDRLPHPFMGVGWNNPEGLRQKIGTIEARTIQAAHKVKWYGKDDPLLYNWGGDPLTIGGHIVWSDVFLSDVARQPEWLYRIDYLLAEHEVREKAPFKPVSVAASPPKDRLKALQNYLAMAKNHKDYARKWGDGKELVGLNNIGEITFNWNSGDDKSVVQKLWWRLKGGKGLLEPFPLTKWIVSLSFNDADYPKLQLPVKP